MLRREPVVRARPRAAPRRRSCATTLSSTSSMSRSALHWVPEADHPPLLAECFRLLRPGGRLRIECGGGDNVRRRCAPSSTASRHGSEARRLPGRSWVRAGTSSWSRRPGFSVEHGWVRTVAQHRAFDREAVIGWLDSQCFQAYEATCRPRRIADFRTEVLARLAEMRSARRKLRPDVRAARRARAPSGTLTIRTETDVTAIGRSTHLDPNRNVRSGDGVLFLGISHQEER